MENLFKKNIKLKNRLLILYTVFVFSLIFIITIVLSETFVSNFNDYVCKKHDEYAEKVVNDVLDLYTSKGYATYDELYKIGLDALDEGMIFMFNEDVGNQLICMSKVDPDDSGNMLENMENTMKTYYPHANGEYQEDTHIVMDESTGTTYGYVTLGYYGPIYYSEYDARFLETVNRSIYVVGVLFFIFSSILIYFLIDKITKPINQVSELAKEISNGNYDNFIESESTTLELQNLITSINLLALKLQEQKQLKKQLAENYTHEIRTPLTCVMTTIEGIQDGVFEPTEERLNSIYKDIERIFSLVDNVDKLVDTVEKDLKLTKQEFDISEVIKNTVLSFENLLISKNIRIDFSNNKSIYINADKDLIKSVVTNLISNAYKYTNENGEINVSVQDNKDTIKILVKDNGMGIEKSEQEMIFEHLYRVDKSRDRKIEGFGIGLALCKNVVLAHKGTIEVESEIGVGSLFTVTLPKILEEI